MARIRKYWNDKNELKKQKVLSFCFLKLPWETDNKFDEKLKESDKDKRGLKNGKVDERKSNTLLLEGNKKY